MIETILVFIGCTIFLGGAYCLGFYRGVNYGAQAYSNAIDEQLSKIKSEASDAHK